MTVLHLCAKNTPTGNPSRCFVAVEGAHILGAWEEGYRGWSAVPEPVRKECGGSPIRVTVSATEMKSFLTEGRDEIGRTGYPAV